MMSIIKFETIENKLIKYNNQWVLLDKDVATLYEIEPKKLRQQLKRNIDKFPVDYAVQLSETDLDIMVSQNVTPSEQHFGGSCPMFLPKIVSIEFGTFRTGAGLNSGWPSIALQCHQPNRFLVPIRYN